MNPGLVLYVAYLKAADTIIGLRRRKDAVHKDHPSDLTPPADPAPPADRATGGRR